MEWLYHIGVPESEIEDMAANSANTVPVMMPYIDAFFMPRAYGDRPKVVPDGAVNFAFLGQFAETPRDTIFTTEYSMRTGREAVYTLLNVDRGVPEVWGSVYDVRDLLDATVKLRNGKKPIRYGAESGGKDGPEEGPQQDPRHRYREAAEGVSGHLRPVGPAAAAVDDLLKTEKGEAMSQPYKAVISKYGK